MSGLAIAARRSTWFTVLLTGAFLVGCAGARTPRAAAPGATLALHAEVSDPVGDALSDPRVPRSPDLEHATADVVAGKITFTVRFAPGTFDRSTEVTVQLDTDQNPLTGIRQVNGLGVEYAIGMGASVFGNRAVVQKAIPTGACTSNDPCWMSVGSVPVVFVADGVDVTVPLSLLGNSNGQLNFKVIAVTQVAQTIPTTRILDVMPDVSLPPGYLGNPIGPDNQGGLNGSTQPRLSPAPQAMIISSSFGSSSQSGVGWNVSGSNTSYFQATAMSFTPTSGFWLTRIDVSISLVSGTNSVVLTLNSDNGGLPGAVVTSWNVGNLPQWSACCTVQTVVPAAPLLLSGGTLYWLVAAPGAADTNAQWNIIPGSTGLVAIKNQGLFFHPPHSELSAFDVVGTAAPD